ncbi:uncharacterized protein MYCFIDRAFT_213948 [Pseudocercospora fijiensis CIRAD86]|uniref:Uncharacterized protein n=1 Tax=Pseudocercospora fijiensis (strain CIRAD86) TaxID=383855 RepID=M3B8N1_PSEFD|nr:uncharacterized protein MYCFIDRAFT_213948 [Pseudocercospora fijiensis CIRAD86]EME85668.1 hypothetical protein MYCFIDRAFT_213948 [Pseudocercospora fijiensis CIRAD86]
MKYTIGALVIAVFTNAQSHGQKAYLASVCQPYNSTNMPDLNAPCNAIAAIQGECIYGPEYLSVPNSNGDRDFGDISTQSNETQRVCLCESQFWDLATGCFSCYKKHGGEMDGAGTISDGTVSSISSKYCAATMTPTAGLADYLFALASSLEPSSTQTGSAQTSVSYLDSIGNKTEVSYYYTPSVTGSAAWLVGQPTGSGSSAVYSTTNVHDGQIRATASANNAAASGGSGTRTGSGAQSTDSGSGAGKHEALTAAGLLGLVGLVAVL